MSFTVTAQQKQQYHQQGFFMTPPLFDPEFTQKVSDEFDRLWVSETARAGGPYQDTQPAGEPGFMISIAMRSRILGEVFRQETFLDVWRGLLGGNADLNYDQIVMKQPESVTNRSSYEFAFHQDNYYALRGGDGQNWDEAIYLDNHRAYQGWMAFSETTLENGTLFVVPGTHRFGLLEHNREGKRGFDCAVDPHVDVAKKIPVLLQPGQLLVFSGLLPHGSGLNRSPSARKVMQFSISEPGGRPAPFARPLLRNGRCVMA